MIKSLGAAIVGALLGSGLTWLMITGSFRVQPLDITYPDLAATLLSAVSVLLAVLGFFIAILAAIGLSQIKSLARKAATDHIKVGLKEGELRAMFEGSVAEISVRTRFGL